MGLTTVYVRLLYAKQIVSEFFFDNRFAEFSVSMAWAQFILKVLQSSQKSHRIVDARASLCTKGDDRIGQ